EVSSPVDEVIPDTVRVITRQRSNNGMSPVIARHGQAAFQQIGIGLQTNVVHAEKHGREGAEPDGDHHPLQINPVSHGRGRSRYLARGIKNGVHCLVEGIPLFMFSTRSEEHTSELQSREKLVCRLLLEKKNI